MIRPLLLYSAIRGLSSDQDHLSIADTWVSVVLFHEMSAWLSLSEGILPAGTRCSILLSLLTAKHNEVRGHRLFTIAQQLNSNAARQRTSDRDEGMPGGVYREIGSVNAPPGGMREE